MINSILEKLRQFVLPISVGIILLFVVARFSFGGFNFSRFIVAGSDFVQSDLEHPNLIINEGQGYDGQFFYRYAHHPLNKEKTDYGVTVDHIEYRIQRIVYPASVWLFSFGGNKSLIPFFLVLLNALAFFGIFFISLKICKHYNADKLLAILPLFLFGAYMSLARDTSEIFEVFFFSVAVYAIIKENFFLFVGSILLSIFSRETSLIAIGPLTFFYVLKLIKNNKLNGLLIFKLISLSVPFIAMVCWKYYLHISIHSEVLVDGSQNLSLPFVGMYYGAINNFNFSDYKSIFETIFWYLFFVWNVAFVVGVIQAINFKQIIKLDVASMLSIVYLFWAVFSIILGPAIYIDDWGFVRIFTLWNMMGFFILIINNKVLNKYLLSYSFLILFLLIIRLVIRV